MKDARYDFGDNWCRFIADLTGEQIAIATADLAKLAGDIRGLSFLDIGSGSGLHSLAALKLGAADVTAFDYDARSVEATRTTLARHAPGASWSADQGDILSPPHAGRTFDVVYSYGVLHHTGHMRRAIENACAYCAPGGLLVLALYVKTPFCPLWSVEKGFYTRFKPLRPVLDALFAAAVLLRRLLAGENPVRYVREYRARRGMAFMTDIRDWLGGYPYESISDAELDKLLVGLGFTPVRKRNVSPGVGLLGTACGEWVYRKD